MIPAQSRAARGLLDWSQSMLADRSGVPLHVVERFEAGRTMSSAQDADALRRALEEGGAEFIPENGGGAGVRLKYNRKDVKGIGRLEGEGGVVADDDI